MKNRWAATGDAVEGRLLGSLPSLRLCSVPELWGLSTAQSASQHAPAKRTKAADLATQRMMLQDLRNPCLRPKVARVTIRQSDVTELYQLPRQAVLSPGSSLSRCVRLFLRVPQLKFK